MSRKSTYGLTPQQLDRLLSLGSNEAENERATSSEDDLPGQGHPQAGSLSSREIPLLQIPGYEILDKLGQAGQGQVWRALQLSTHREVALKLPLEGVAHTEKALIRFEREVELAASLQHPNIARIHDSGLHQGIYFYAMDLIDGMHLDDYVRAQNLQDTSILALMQTVCEAVQHAHQNGVIHRDLKPSNIIVTHDGQPFIVDFGLARNLHLKEGAESVSLAGEIAGTPAYMSPEQAAGQTDQLDTRTDVYSLGVLLFVLLTGQTPHDMSGSHYELMRRIAEEPVRHPRKLCPRIDPDVQWLLLKALDQDPNRRYSSAGALAEDIDRYLNGIPLLAAPPSTVYRLKHFVRRHRMLVLSAAAVLIVLVGGIVASTHYALGQSKARAQQARAFAENKATTQFLRYYILGPLGNANAPSIREVFDNALKTLGSRLAEYPHSEAELRFNIGKLYLYRFSTYDVALSNLERAVVLKPGSSATYKNYLGLAYNRVGRYADAEALFRFMVDWRDEAIAQGRREPNDFYCTLKYHLAETYLLMGHYDEAEHHLREAERIIRQKWYGQEFVYKRMLPDLLREQGRYEEARRLYGDLLERSRSTDAITRGEDLRIMKELGILYTLDGRLDEATPLLEEALEKIRQKYGEDHRYAADYKIPVAVLRMKQGDYDQAKTLFNEALKNMQTRLDNDHPEVLRAKSHLGVLYREQDLHDEAEKLLSKVIQGQSQKLGPDHPHTLESMHELAVLYVKQGQQQQAADLLAEVAEGRLAKLGDKHPHTQESLSLLIDLYKVWDKPEQANQWRAKLPVNPVK